MAVSWGHWFNASSGGGQRWRVGIDASHSGNTGRYSIWVNAGAPVADTVSVYWSGGGSRSLSISTTAPVLVASNVTFSVSPGGSYGINAYIDRSTIYANGRPSSNPSASITYRVSVDTPSTPGSPSGDNLSSNSIRIISAVPNNNGSTIVEYQAQLATESSFGVGAWGVSSGNRYIQVNGLTRYTRYHYRTRARNSAGWSSWSVSRDFVTWSTVPGPYSAPGIENVTANSAFLRFGSTSDSGGLSQIDAQYQIATNASFISLVKNEVVTSDPTITGLSIATTYYARTRARNAEGWGPWSNTTQFSTDSIVPSQVPAPRITSITQYGAQVGWSAPASGGNSIIDYTVERATNAAFTAGRVSATVRTLSTALSGLNPDSTYYVRVRARNGVGTGPWSSTTSFSTTSGQPSIVSSSSLPTVRTNGKRGATVKTSGWPNAFTVTVQLATNSLFTSGLQNLTQSFTRENSNGLHDVTNSVLQPNGTYYVRAKIRNNVTGYETDWSPTQSYRQSHTPSVIANGPRGDEHYAYEPETSFSFTASDSAIPFDRITDYQISIQVNDTGASVYNTNKTPLSSTSPTTVVGIAIPASYKSQRLRWRVRVWDAAGHVSNWSGYSLFTVADPPVVTLTAPVPGAPVDNGSPTFAWSATFPSGGTQASAHVSVLSTRGSVVWEATVGSATSVRPPRVVLENGSSYTVNIVVTDTTGLVSSISEDFTVSYISPPSVQFTVEANEDIISENGYVYIDWSHTAPDERLAAWVIYRRELPRGDWQMIAAITNIGERSYEDWSAISGRTYQYSVTQRADRSGILLESPVGYHIPAEGTSATVDERIYDVVFSDYWLIVEGNERLSYRIGSVVSDDFTEEYETATHNVIGRGRHRDYGTRYGYTGSLSIQFRGPLARARRQELEALRARHGRYLLRTPFGDMFYVALGDPSISRVPGTGSMEMTDVSIDYEEVY